MYRQVKIKMWTAYMIPFVNIHRLTYTYKCIMHRKYQKEHTNNCLVVNSMENNRRTDLEKHEDGL